MIAPNQQVTIQGVRQGLERVGVTASYAEAERIIIDVREGLYGKFEISYKDFVDFFTKRRVNVSMTDKGFVDPLLASAVSSLNRIRETYDLTLDKMF